MVNRSDLLVARFAHKEFEQFADQNDQVAILKDRANAKDCRRGLRLQEIFY